MKSSDITINAEDVEKAARANPAVDWALKEQALLRTVGILQAEIQQLKNGTKPKKLKEEKNA